MTSRRAFAAVAAVFASLCAFLPAHSTAQTNGQPERFTAVAINMGSPGRAGANQVEIVVNRWSTEAERHRLLQALFDKGPEKLLDTLVELPRVGYFRTPATIGYDLHYAHREKLPDGGERTVPGHQSLHQFLGGEKPAALDRLPVHRDRTALRRRRQRRRQDVDGHEDHR